MTPEEMCDSTRLTLHPLRIAPFGDGHYSVIRRGGREEIATRALGVQALARLRAGDSLGEARQWLAEHHATQPGRIQLTPLLNALMNAGMVAAVDGRPIETPRVGVKDYLRFQLRFEVLPRAVRAARRLPLSLSRPVLKELFAHDLKTPCARKVQRAGASFGRVFPGVYDGGREAFEKDYFEHLVWNVVDLESLRGRSFAQIDAWLESFVRLEGLESLDWARRQGRGVMLVGYHFSSNRLMTVALMRRGYSIMSMGAINLGWGAQKTKDLIDDWRQTFPSYGNLELVDNLDLGSVNTLVKELRQGGTVLTMPDVYSLSTFEDQAVAERSKFFGVVRSQFRPAVMSVRFFNHQIDVNPWGGWLAVKAQPVILPVLVERKARQLVCRFGEPFKSSEATGDARERMQTVTDDLFHVLEREVGRIPAQWFGWHNLDKLDPRPLTPVATDCS